MTIEEYLASNGVAARNALVREDRLDVIQAVAQRDPRKIVQQAAERRLRVLQAEKAEAPEADPEATPGPQAAFGWNQPAVQTPEPAPAAAEPEPVVEAAPAAEPAAEPETEDDEGEPLLPPAAPRRPVGASRVDIARLRGVYRCRKCERERPVESFGTRRVGSHVYLQPHCTDCRRKPKAEAEAQPAA